MDSTKLYNYLHNISGVLFVCQQPPENIKLSYPAIIYKMATIRSKFANNDKYLRDTAYDITLIDTEPESPIVEDILKLPTCNLSQTYVKDNLYHYIFRVYL